VKPRSSPLDRGLAFCRLWQAAATRRSYFRLLPILPRLPLTIREDAMVDPADIWVEAADAIFHEEMPQS
jgi:hypothetical protein